VDGAGKARAQLLRPQVGAPHGIIGC
jgi:hypothetical protein